MSAGINPAEHLGLARLLTTSFFRKRKNKYVTYDDLYQEASVALCLAARTFDPNHGARFSTYAYVTITNQLREFYATNERLLKYGGVNTMSKITQFRRKQTIDPATLAQDVGYVSLSPEELDRLVGFISGYECSWDSLASQDFSGAPIHSDFSSTSIHDVLTDPQDTEAVTTLPMYYSGQFRKVIESAKLVPKQRTRAYELAIRRWFSDDPEDYETVGKDWGCSRQAVFQFEQKIIPRIRAAYQELYGTPEGLRNPPST